MWKPISQASSKNVTTTILGTRVIHTNTDQIQNQTTMTQQILPILPIYVAVVDKSKSKPTCFVGYPTKLGGLSSNAKIKINKLCNTH